MEARISKWKKLSEERHGVVTDFEVMRAEASERDAKERENQRIANQIKQLPLRFQGKTFSDYETFNQEQVRIKHLAERYVQTFQERAREGTSIKFLGRPGTGKTLLSLIIYQELVKQGYRTRYESSTEFLKKLFEVKYQSQANFDRELQNYRQYSLLILDEVTESVNRTGILTENDRQILFQIINDRYANKLCTLVITNRSESSLAKCLGERIVDRLSEKGITCAFQWDSYRQK